MTPDYDNNQWNDPAPPSGWMKLLAGLVVFGSLAILVALALLIGGVYAILFPGLFGLALLYLILR